MKKFFFLLLISNLTYAQNLSPEEQKRLIEENKFLKEEILKCKSRSQTQPQDSKKMMEALQKGQKFQEDQLKALQELDLEE